jgi:hypothetical protein
MQPPDKSKDLYQAFSSSFYNLYALANGPTSLVI